MTSRQEVVDTSVMCSTQLIFILPETSQKWDIEVGKWANEQMGRKGCSLCINCPPRHRPLMHTFAQRRLHSPT